MNYGMKWRKGSRVIGSCVAGGAKPEEKHHEPVLRLGKLDHVARFRFRAAFEKSKLAIVAHEKAVEIVFAANFFDQSFSNMQSFFLRFVQPHSLKPYRSFFIGIWRWAFR